MNIDGPVSSGIPLDEFLEMIIPRLIIIGVILLVIWFFILLLSIPFRWKSE